MVGGNTRPGASVVLFMFSSSNESTGVFVELQPRWFSRYVKLIDDENCKLNEPQDPEVEKERRRVSRCIAKADLRNPRR